MWTSLFRPSPLISPCILRYFLIFRKIVLPLCFQNGNLRLAVFELFNVFLFFFENLTFAIQEDAGFYCWWKVLISHQIQKKNKNKKEEGNPTENNLPT